MGGRVPVANGVIAPAIRDRIEKISPCEAPHSGRAGDLREYDRLQHHCQEVVMGSGAYSVFIDHEAPGGGPTRALRRVVPLPPPELSGASSSLPLFFRSHMTTLGSLARLRQSLPR